MSCGLIEKLEGLVQGERRPDTVVLMDMPPEIGLARAKARGDLDRFEQEAQTFFERVREGYLDRAKQDPNRYVIVNAAEALPQVQHALEAMAARWFDGP